MALIDNKDKTLLEALENALDHTESVDILTGFFYFSGFHKLAEKLKDKKIRILVGLAIEPGTTQKLIVEQQKNPNVSLERFVRVPSLTGRTERKREYIDGFTELFNTTALHDNSERQHAYKLFEDKLRDGSLEIKLASDKDHGKSFILHYKPEYSQGGGDAKGVAFMGSSNFTYSGLTGQGELNDSFRDNDRLNDYQRHFDQLWEDSDTVSIQAEDSNHEFIERIEKEARGRLG